MRFTIGKRLGVAIGVLLALFLTAVAYSYVQMHALERATRQVTEIEDPTSSAAYEMEINVIGAGWGVLGYLHDRDSLHLEQIRDDESDFARYRAQYHTSAQTDTAKALGVRLDQGYARFRALADELIGIEDRQALAMDTLLALFSEVDDLLDDRIQPSIRSGAPSPHEKMEAVLEMEINLNEIARRLEAFLRTHDSRHEGQIEEDARDLERYLAAYRDLASSSEERVWARRIAQLFGRVVSLARNVIALDKAQEAGLREFVRVRRGMDQVLDDEIQTLTSSGMRRATATVHGIVSRSTTVLLILLLVGSGLGGSTALVVGRSVTNPVRQLLSACERVARGDFSQPVHVETRDEFTLLAESFNAMASERERAETALRRRDELQLVIDANPSLIFVKDWDGRLTLANKTVAEFYGTTVEELLGKRGVDRHASGDVVEQSLENDQAVMTTGRAKVIPEVPVKNRVTGEARWFQMVKVPLPSAPGATRQMLVVATDISDRKRTEAALAQAKDELEAFSYSVAHNLRAPLRGIDGFSQALLEDYSEKLDAEGKRYLERVRESAQHMAQLIESLLTLARVTQSDLRRERVDLSALARATARRIRAAQPERNVEFLITDGLTAHGDSRLLGVALENLLSNAWKFTQGRPQARIEFDCRQEDEQPVFVVRDNGAGFDMGFASKLFGVFQRLHTPDEFEGTGIGLATAQRIVHRHGGRIWAEGKVDEGASFYFTLAEGGRRE